MDRWSSEAEFRPEDLSQRERAVLDHAVSGMTDAQIAQAMGVSLSTINSYWVRIRGKIGQFSRTELVGRVLTHDHDRRIEELIEENARLRAETAASQEGLLQSQADLRATQDSSWHLAALENIPEATFVCRPPGHVIYANAKAHALFLAAPGSFEGLPAWDLTIPEHRDRRENACYAFFESDVPPYRTAGLDEPYYAQRRDGTNFRALLMVQRFDNLGERMAILTIRDFMHEADAILEALRRPFERPETP